MVPDLPWSYCTACGGAGMVEVRAFAAGASPYDKDITCPTCHGEGIRIHPADRQYPARNQRRQGRAA